jgi:hypothetical protein
MTPQREAVAETVERIVAEVSDWPHVTVGEHRFGGTEFRIGSREIGHVHAWGMLDVAYLRALRDALVEAGHTGVHHLLTESGWTTYRVESAEDFDHALWLLRLSYLYHVNVLRKTPAGAEEFADVDVDGELDGMDLGEAVRAAFERRPPAGADRADA